MFISVRISSVRIKPSHLILSYSNPISSCRSHAMPCHAILSPISPPLFHAIPPYSIPPHLTPHIPTQINEPHLPYPALPYIPYICTHRIRDIETLGERVANAALRYTAIMQGLHYITLLYITLHYCCSCQLPVGTYVVHYLHVSCSSAQQCAV